MGSFHFWMIFALFFVPAQAGGEDDPYFKKIADDFNRLHQKSKTEMEPVREVCVVPDELPERPLLIVTMNGNSSIFEKDVPRKWDFQSKKIDQGWSMYFLDKPAGSRLVRTDYLSISPAKWAELYGSEDLEGVAGLELIERIRAHPELIRGQRPSIEQVEMRIAFLDYLRTKGRDNRRDVLKGYSQNWKYDQKLLFLQNFLKMMTNPQYYDGNMKGLDEEAMSSLILEGKTAANCKFAHLMAGLMATDMGFEVFMDSTASRGGGHATLLMRDPKDPNSRFTKLNWSSAQNESFDRGSASATYLGDVSTNHRYYAITNEGHVVSVPVTAVLSPLGEVLIVNSGGDPDTARLFPNGPPNAQQVGASIRLPSGWGDMRLNGSFADLPDETKLWMMGVSHKIGEPKKSFYSQQIGLSYAHHFIENQQGNELENKNPVHHVFIFYHGEIRKIVYDEDALKVALGTDITGYWDTALVEEDNPSFSWDFSIKPYVEATKKFSNGLTLKGKVEGRGMIDRTDLWRSDAGALRPYMNQWRVSVESQKKISQKVSALMGVDFGQVGRFGNRYTFHSGVQTDSFRITGGVTRTNSVWSGLDNAPENYFLDLQWKASKLLELYTRYRYFTESGDHRIDLNTRFLVP